MEFSLWCSHGNPWASCVLCSNEEKTPVKVAKTYPLCWDCAREMSPTLDSYYGKDPEGKDFCAPCRRKKGIK